MGADHHVGRDGEFERLANLWDKAHDGFRQAALVGGEPGVGKTTLASALARRAHETGAVVLYGRCDEDVGIAFEPFVQAIAVLVDAMSDADLAGLGHHAPHLARLYPAVAHRVPGLDTMVSTDAEGERYSLFEAVVALVAMVANDTPVLMVLDDLHWADKATLLLLRHLLRADLDLRLLVVATYRDTEVDRTHAFAEVLADLRREIAVERIAVTGLERRAVQQLVTDLAGHDLDGRALELSDTLHDQTGGNPFFIAEVLRHLAESGAIYQDAGGRWTSDLDVGDIGLPEGVRDVVGRRLSRLSEEANRAMTLAAVAGTSFVLRLVEVVSDADERGTVIDALGEGVDAGLLTEDGGRYAFPHALVRRTLLDELSSMRRMRLHRRVGDALEVVAPDELDSLAFHFAEAAADGVAAKAGTYALAAARRSHARSAFETAAAQLERGIEALELDDLVDRALRCDLLLELGDLQRWLGHDEATETGRRAAEDARATESAHRLVRAATIVLNPATGHSDPAAAELGEEALAALGADPIHEGDTIRAHVQLLVLLGWQRIEGEGRRDDGLAMAAEALRVAQDAPPEVAALAQHASWRWNPQPALADIEAVMAAIPVDLRNAELLSDFFQARAVERLDAGDAAGFDAVAVEIDELAARTHGWYPTYISLAFATIRSLLDGRWDDAAHTLGLLGDGAARDANATNVWAGNLLLHQRDLGNFDDLLPLLEITRASNPGVPGFHAAVALVQAELGQHDLAVDTFASLAGDSLWTIPTNQVFAVTFAMIAEVIARIGDVDSARTAYERMTEPSVSSAGRVSTINGTVVVGATDRFLGMLAATFGDSGQAQRHFEVAVDLESRLGARPYLVRTNHWYGRMLAGRDAPGDGDRARAMWSGALEEAEALAMAGAAIELRAELGRLA